MKWYSPSCLLLLIILLPGCDDDRMDYKQRLHLNTDATPDLTFKRYEEMLFHLDTSRFQEELMAVKQDYLPFLSGDLSDPEAIRYLKDFTIDSLSRVLYNKVKETYPDLKEVKEQVASVYGHFRYYYPEISLPQQFYTCVSGINPDIPPVLLADDAVVISLDWYLDHDEFYDWIGMPKYRSERTGKENLSVDLSQLLYESFLPCKHAQSNILEEMIGRGKALFFVEALCPDISDETLLGYSKEQLEWATQNEGELWADIIGNQCLYSDEYELFRTFFNDGPFTNEYSYEAPARLGEFIGLHIIRTYFNSHEIALRTMLEDADFQGLFQDSGYKPKK